MTQEEKLEEARRLYETANADQKYVLESLFPELIESEDERIRQWLIGYFNQYIIDGMPQVFGNGLNVKDVIAWLEKQGEIIKEWSEMKFNNIQTELQEMVDLKQKTEQGEQKPAWSEEDEVKINRIVACLENLNVADNDILLKDINWLKSLKERVQPQLKQEWNQNDIDMIDWLIRCCEKEHEELCNDKYGHQDIVSDLKRDCRKKWNWLESLKNKVVPQNRWKPSDEQMKQLHKYCPDNRPLTQLYQDLKKLMEE